MFQRAAAVFALYAAGLAADPGVARSAHFEVYEQAGPASAREILLDFERLRTYFLQRTGLRLDGLPAVRVIAFRSHEEYAPYQLRPAADAYYIGSESRDTIVMTAPGDDDIRVAAHEYAHFVLHANGLVLPPWRSEGLSEVFSAVRVSPRDRRAGAQLPALRVAVEVGREANRELRVRDLP